MKINGEYRKDLEMMLGFLKIANDSISMNSIAFHKPTHIYHSDSCPHELGGTATKVGHGNGTSLKICVSEPQTISLNTSPPSSLPGLTSLLDDLDTKIVLSR